MYESERREARLLLFSRLRTSETLFCLSSSGAEEKKRDSLSLSTVSDRSERSNTRPNEWGDHCDTTNVECVKRGSSGAKAWWGVVNSFVHTIVFCVRCFVGILPYSSGMQRITAEGKLNETSERGNPSGLHGDGQIDIKLNRTTNNRLCLLVYSRKYVYLLVYRKSRPLFVHHPEDQSLSTAVRRGYCS